MRTKSSSTTELSLVQYQVISSITKNHRRDGKGVDLAPIVVAVSSIITEL